MTMSALINVTARPRAVTIVPEHVQTLSPEYLSLADKARAVTIRIDVHDEYYSRERKRWRERLAAAHPDKRAQRSRAMQEQAAAKFRELAEAYAAWLLDEVDWYKVAGLKPPAWGQ